MGGTWWWVGFCAFVAVMLALDLGIFQRKAHEVRFKEALTWTIVWVLLALGFAGLVYHQRGAEDALQFVTGYLVEESLSVDNLFVFLLIFSYFKVPPVQQHRVLFWGVLGALVLRGVFIAAGVALVHRFHWVIFVFGGFLVIAGIKLFFHKEEEQDLSKNIILRWLKRLIPITHEYFGEHFFVKTDADGQVKHDGGAEAGLPSLKLLATPLFATLVVVEASDVIFAFDSIPAILAISTDTFIVYTSNIFAIMGLRSLYFCLAGVMNLFRFLKYGLAIILTFIGVKMLIQDYYKIPTLWSLAAVGGILFVSIVVSLLWAPRTGNEAPTARN
ncbi:MAG TPA: TerC family protein [Planctomycetota bacterium]